MTPILKLTDISKIYVTNNQVLKILDSISIALYSGDTFSIVGPSGSGKTTLLGICAGLDNPSSGTVEWNGVQINTLTEDKKAFLRSQSVGFIFQNFQLLPTLNALENVMIPLELQGKYTNKKKAIDLLERVGLGKRIHHYPLQLSGGEQQRVAIARAFIHNPSILFADEPTGNLDTETAETVENILFELNKENKTTLVLVTHNKELAQKTSQIITLKNGKMV
ncbi:MAG: ABC transporter ATP-binding protein [Chitinophagaceae bacterium]|nr:ABC transporter ATP-binding protein [Chitinophagaceae bacterium]